MIWARHQFELDILDRNGVSSREHLIGALSRAKTEARRRLIEADLAGPSFPRPLEYLWLLFVEIADGLEANGWVPPVVTWQSLAAWSQLSGISLQPFEALALVRLGAIRASVIGKSDDAQGSN